MTSGTAFKVFGELFSVSGTLGRFARANLYVIWFGLLLLAWLINPISAMPYPSEVWLAMQDLYNAPGRTNLVYNSYVSLKLNIVGLGCAVLLSLPIAYLSVIPLFRPFNSAVQTLRYIPVVGFNLMFLAWFSIGWSMKVAMFMTGMSFFLVTGMTGVVASIPLMKYELARVLGYSDWETFYSVVVRGTAPQMLDVIAQNAAIGWLMIVAVETFNRTEGGIGSQLHIYNDINRLAEVYAYLIVIGVFAVLGDWSFSLLKRILFPFTRVAERA